MVTMAALLPPRPIAPTIGDKGGDDVLIVQEHQPQWRADIALVFTLPLLGDRPNTAQTVDLGHGRSAPRNMPPSAALVGSSDWPGLAQVFELGRPVMFPHTGKARVEVG
jgi:hypothetical protein